MEDERLERVIQKQRVK